MSQPSAVNGLPDTYHSTVEDAFRELRGHPLFRFSPADWELLGRWKSQGVPLDVVLAGVRETFENARRGGRMVGSLRYCEPAVAERARRAASAGSAEERRPPSRGERIDVDARLRELAARLRDEGWAEQADELLGLAGFEGLPAELVAAMARIEKSIAEEIWSRLSAERRAELSREVTERLGQARITPRAPAFARLRERQLNERTLAEAGLPALSLMED